jgi:hypothetical protein
MPSRVLLATSAAAMALAGVLLTFLPQEVLAATTGVAATPPAAAIVQVAGALYLGFAILDWMNRGNRHGGIYGRPLVVANLLQFWAAGMALLKAGGHPALTAAGVVSLALGVAFGALLFREPS